MSYEGYEYAHMSAGQAYLMALAGLAAMPFQLTRRACGIVGRVLVRVAGE